MNDKEIAQKAIDCLVNKCELELKHYEGTDCYLLITDAHKLYRKETVIDKDSYECLAKFNLPQRIHK